LTVSIAAEEGGRNWQIAYQREPLQKKQKRSKQQPEAEEKRRGRVEVGRVSWVDEKVLVCQ